MPRNFGAIHRTLSHPPDPRFATAQFAAQTYPRWSNLQNNVYRRHAKGPLCAIQMKMPP
jgi:hypothetical protein